MSALLTPRPLPNRRPPALAGGALVALALPLFALADWRLAGWAIGAGLWAASQLLGLLFARIGIGAPTLRGSGVVAFGMMGRGVAIPLVLLALAAAGERELALAAALVYAAGYTIELALSLALYYTGARR